MPFFGGHPQLAIDLADDGPTANDPLDEDSGSNGLQNYPIITLADRTHIVGFLHSAPSTTYTLDFYTGSFPCRPHDYSEPLFYLGAADVTTDATGSVDFDVPGFEMLPIGGIVIATATDPNGNTSELSPRIVFSIDPASGAAAGGTPVTIHGTEFIDGATVTIGGQAVGGVAVVNDHTITATSPALTPGTANDVVVSEGNGAAGTLFNGFLVDFLDVPPGQQFYAYITTLVEGGITVGVGGGMYGVDQPTLRQQMAVFLLKSKHGPCGTPQTCAGIFLDVPCPSTFGAWIEELATEGITGGCGGGNFCPTSPVRRDQMAVFLLKAGHGSDYEPPPCAGMFGDVPCPSPFADWVEQLAAEQITGGCGGGNYCPSSSNTRGQMAVFLVKTFGIQ